MFDLSKQEVNINCPGCGARNKITMQQAKDQVSIECIGCKKKINLVDKDGSVNKSINDVNKSFKDLENTLKNFGK